MTSTTARAGPPRRSTTPVFVGRRPERETVDAAWAQARAGVPRTVCVEGAPGTGKTALIARCLSGWAPVSVLWAAGDEVEKALAHGVLDQLTAGLPAAVVDRFPLLRPDRDPRADPLAVGADLLGALGSLGALAAHGASGPADEPVLVVVDDLQWADTASIQVLAFVLRRLRHDRVLLLMGLRVPAREPNGTVAEAPWERLLAAGRDGVWRVRLDGLDTAEVSELAAAVGRPLGSTGAAERLRHHTHGHPMHARALLEELSPEVLAGTTDVLPAPRSLQAVVLVRLSRATAAAQALVVAASVLGEVCPLGLATAVAGLDDAASALDGAVTAGLLEDRAGESPARIAFTHPLVRAAVHADLAPTRRRELHAAAAARLSGRPALDHRVAAAAGPDPGLAAELEAFVVEPTAELAGAEAADLLRAAAELTTAPGDRERRHAVAVSRLLADGEVARAVAMEPVVDGWRPGPRRSAVLGQLALLSGRFGRARERLEAALDPDGDDAGDGAARANATAHLAVLHLLQGDPARAIERAAAALSAGAGDPAVRLPAGMALVLGFAASGRREDARGVLDRAGPDDGGPAAVDVVLMRGVLDALADDDVAAAGHLEEALRRARAGEPVRAPALGMAFLPAVQDRLGSGDGIVEAFELAVSLARDGGTALPGTLARAFAAEALAVRGRRDDARAHLDEAAAHGPHWWGSAACLAVAGAVLADVEDDPEGVLRALAPALAPRVRPLTDGLGMLAPRVLEIDALIGLGRCDEAAVALDALDVLLARPADRPPGRHAVDAARLRLRLGRGGLPSGPAGLGLDGVRAPLALARLEAEIGRRLLAVGERRAGLDLLRTARDRLVRLGAVPWRQRCEELLHGAGLTPSETDEALGLTPHEEAVVALVARGLTNREVGGRLFITPRTVAYHLSNVYAKLGVTSRRGLRDLVTQS